MTILISRHDLPGWRSGFSLVEEIVPAFPRGDFSKRCAYCGAPLPVNIEGVEAWRIGDAFVCNEFCADGVPEALTPTRAFAQLAPKINVENAG